ncbi:MAG: SUMF1/EgtB/PvdO family nonheme iron enzyme [Planctomycetes bacterium]|nr:SUMF1/EgtB/PvdO family nonheme iron enzyme [Planctomycetota bacterium]
MSDDPLLNKGELGPYKIERKLGQGAMGGVYLARHRVLDVYHAIKVIHPKLIGDQTLVERFLREARNTARLKHMNIVQVVGADQVDGIYYLAMEFVEGKTLEQIMRSPGLNLHDSVRYIHMVANALAYAHSRNIIHRDIKPANIMINEEDIAKLMDFGLVRDVGQPEGGESGEQLTMAGYIMGTPQYMPLEQWQGEGVDHRSDIYALGATLYVMLCGKLPFPGKNARDIFRNVLTSQAKLVNEHNPDIDRDLAAIVHKAIAPEKDDRYQTSQEMALALEAWWDQHPYQGTSLFKAPTMEETRGVTGARSVLSSSSANTKAASAPPAATRAMLQHGSTLEGSTPTSMGSLQPRSKAPMIAVALLVLIAAAVGAYIIFGGKDNGSGSPTQLAFELAIPPDRALEALPLAVNKKSFSIPGTSNGEVTLNGVPYALGDSINLKPGLNTLHVKAALGESTLERTLFVLLDESVPLVAVPDLAGRDGNVIPTTVSSYKLKGSVTDEGSGLDGLKVTLLIDGELRELVLDPRGGFERDIPVSEKDVTLELMATDRAGNQTQALTFWVSPDRNPLSFIDEPKGAVWVTTENFTISGKLSKNRGVTLAIDGKPTKLDTDGNFSATVTRAPGRHDIAMVATDWIGNIRELKRSVVVDLDPPKLTLELPQAGTLRVESVPAGIAVQGTLDSADAVLTVNGRVVTVNPDGTFAIDVQTDAFGPFKVTLEATDPARRTTPAEVVIEVKRLLYKPLEKNAQGHAVYERISDGMLMVLVPGGKFTRGVAEVLPDAREREIELSPYLIAMYEVTRAQFAKFLTESRVNADDALGRRWLVKDETGEFAGLQVAGNQWSAAEGEGQFPVTHVTWTGAQAYCKWADADTGDLPSEAQWEFAARGTDGRQFPWGNEPVNTRRANIKITGRDATVTGDTMADGDSPFGLRMMAGNVEEWCLDWYEEGGYALPGQQGKDPVLRTKPGASNRRVARGGSWQSPRLIEPQKTDEDAPGDIRTYARSRRLPDKGADDRGFRPAAKLPQD